MHRALRALLAALLLAAIRRESADAQQRRDPPNVVLIQADDLGYGDLSEERLVQFRIHGVTPDFIRDVRAAGFKDMTAEDLVDFSIHGRRWMKRRAG